MDIVGVQAPNDNMLASMQNEINDQSDTLNAKRSSEIGSRTGSRAGSAYKQPEGKKSVPMKMNLGA